jgi:beta-glucanase (GH16 family)
MKKVILALFSAGTFAAETLIFSDNFDTFDMKKWQHELTMGGGGNWEFEIYRNNRTNSFVRNGVLYIQPTLTSEAIGLTTMQTGSYSMWGGTPADMCTSNAWYGCERNAGASGNYINPIMSARLRTVNSFSFTYGRVEVKAQLPKGDWIWPAIWLLPTDHAYGTWPASGEIDIMESRGNAPGCSAGGSDTFGSTLHWGPSWDNNRYDLTHADYKHTESLGDAFHIYGLLWTPDRIMTYIDSEDNVVLDVDTSSQSFWEKGGFTIDNPWVNEPNNAPFNRDFYLILNVAVGGTNAYFPDGQCGKTWTNDDSRSANTFWNTHGVWYPTWNYPATNQSAMKIDSVNVWSIDESKVFL